MFSLLEVQGVQEVRGRRLQREERGRRIQRLDRSPTHTNSTMFYVTDFSIQKYFIMMNCLLLSHSNHEDTIKEAGFLLETTASAWNLRMDEPCSYVLFTRQTCQFSCYQGSEEQHRGGGRGRGGRRSQMATKKTGTAKK